MPASKPAPAIEIVPATRRRPIAIEHLKADLRTANKQLDMLMGEVRRLQAIVHEMQSERAA